MKSSEQNALLNWFTSRRRSLRLRLVVLVFFIVLITITLMAFYTLKRFEEASIYQIQHEAMVLSDVFRTAIVPSLMGTPDIPALQAQIDRVVASREKNDIEINIMLLQGYRSTIVASNIPDNIEKTDIYEHRDLLASLQQDQAIMFIGRDDDSPQEPPAAPNSPDFYIRPGHRFVSVTTPLVVDGKKMGSINTKLSLTQIDVQLARIRSGIVLMGLILPILALILVLWAVQRGLAPLSRLASEVATVEPSSLSHRFSSRTAPTELQPVITRLNELLQRLQSAFERERRFTANVAHELRTPIATLKTLAEVGLQEVSNETHDANTLAYYRDALSVARQMEQLVVNLLGLVRCESGLQKINVKALNLKEIIESAWDVYENAAREKQLYCQFNLTNSAAVHSDSTLLKAILQNLLSNAVTYTKNNGTILCSLELERETFLFSLTNTNTALTQDNLDQLFEPFWRKDPSRSDDTHCGIGLSLVAAYSKLLKIDIQTELPSPELFRISLRIPASRQEVEC